MVISTGVQPTGQTSGSSASAPVSVVPITNSKSKNWEAVVTADGSDSLSAALQTISEGSPADIVKPVAPQVTSPGLNPFVTGSSESTLIISCEVGATLSVQFDTAELAQLSCDTGSASFLLSVGSSGSYQLSLLQTDGTGNVSDPGSFTFVYDPALPAAPVILSPVGSEIYSSEILLLTGSCLPDHIVHLSGVANAETSGGSTSMLCELGNFSFSVDKSAAGDNDYQIGLTQERTDTSAISPATSFMYHYDNNGPELSVLSPVGGGVTSSGTLNVSGSCEAGIGVDFQSDAGSQVLNCDGLFQITIAENVEGTYVYTFSQTDRAGNTSVPVTVTWIKYTAVVNPPQNLLPANPNLSRETYLDLSGFCDSGHTVVLSGDVIAADIKSPVQSLSQDCINNSFLFTISKSDGTYSLNVSQVIDGVFSEAVPYSYVRDTTGPEVKNLVPPANPNVSATATFLFSSAAADLGGFNCQIDLASWVVCSSPVSYTSLGNGVHTFRVQAVDNLGNIGSTLSSTWTQSSQATLALYHFDAGSGFTTDSAIGEAMTLTDHGTSSVAGRSTFFGEGRSFSGSNLTASDHPNLSLMGSAFTVELWMQSLQFTKSDVVSLMSQQAASDFGFDLVMVRQGGSSNYRLKFSYSNNGSTVTTLTSNTFIFSASQWHHIAVTYSNGNIVFFYDGAIVGSLVGTAGSLFDSHADLKIGSGPSGDFTGSLDEIRISQTIRYTSGFTPASTPFNPQN